MSDLVGYARVSTRDQDYNGQQAELEAAGCTRIYREKEFGARTDRPELRKAIARLESGDVLVVSRLDRLARSTRDLLEHSGGDRCQGGGILEPARQLGRHHHTARSADVDRARWSGRIRAGADFGPELARGESGPRLAA